MKSWRPYLTYLPRWLWTYSSQHNDYADWCQGGTYNNKSDLEQGKIIYIIQNKIQIHYLQNMVKLKH